MQFVLVQTFIVMMMLHIVSCVPCRMDKANSETRVLCNKRRLTRLPRTWPVFHITWLDVSTNELSSCQGLDNPRLAELRHLDLRNNLLRGVPSEDLGHVPDLQWLDLSDNPLSSLPAESFSGVPRLTWLGLRNTSLMGLSGHALLPLSNLVTLDLSYNSFQDVPVSALKQLKTLRSLSLGHNGLTDIADHSFSSLTNLNSLDISSNKLYRLSSGVFQGLSQLEEMDITQNHLLLNNDSYPVDVFKPLSALRSLRMANNDVSVVGEYPLNVFNPLAKLKVLSIDTFSETYFGEAFSSMKSLTHLYLDDSCQISMLTNSTLAAFKNSSLEFLSMNCVIGKIETCAFCHLPKLRTLKLNYNSHLTLDTALRAMYGLQNQSLSLIDLSGTKYQLYTATVDRGNSQYLANICVENLNLRNSMIGSFTTSSFNYFRGRLIACLKHLDLAENMINNWVSARLFGRIMYKMKNLESFQIQDQRIRTITDDLCAAQTEDCGRDPPGTNMVPNVTLYLPVSPGLRRVNVTGFVLRVPDVYQVVNFLHAGNLTSMDLSYIGLGRCDFQLQNLETLQYFSLRGNYCQLMSRAFFHHMGNLRRLVLASLNLDQVFLLAEGNDLLSRLPLLEELDLSLNSLFRLPSNLLTAQSNLKKLNLAQNKFREVPVDVIHGTTLSELDLSSNLLTSLSLHERNVFDAMVTRQPGFTLRLRGNPFSCTCSSLDFVHWLATTAVRLDGDNDNNGHDDDYDDNGRVFVCFAEDGNLTTTGVVIRDWDFHWRRCSGPQALWVALTLLSFQLLALLLTYMLTRNWTHVLYVLHAWRSYKLPRREDFRKDAYVGYADVDVELALELDQCLQRCRGVRLLLRYEEELPGSIRAENIVDHIDDSWKVLVMVTQAMTQDEWSSFTLQQAQRSISDTMPDRVIIIFMDDPVRLPYMRSLERLLRMVPERNVFHIPRHTSSHHSVWDRLTETICTTDRDTSLS